MTANPPAPGRQMTAEEMQHLILWITDQLYSSLNGKIRLTRNPDTITVVEARFRALREQANIELPRQTMEHVYDGVLDELLGYGPIDVLLRDDTISEVMVNGPDHIYVERDGKVTQANVRFLSDDHIMRVINKVIEPLGRTVNRTHPMVDARLPDGSRVNAIIPPCAIDGPSITIRKFSRKPLTVDDLIGFGTLTQDMADFLEACVVSRLNVIIAGGTGSGKTTLLNVVSGYIPDDERIITIEDAAELQLAQTHVVRLETVAAEPDGTGAVSIRDLVTNSLRMRPERIIVGECRGGEALDMLQAMNTGHDGSLTTIHANTPRDTIARLETLVMMSGMALPLEVVRRQIASALDLIVQQARLRDGSRKITHITEVQGLESNTVVLQPIFEFEDQGEQDGKVIGRLKPVGIRPKFMNRLITRGFNLPASVFTDSERSAELERSTASTSRNRR